LLKFDGRNRFMCHSEWNEESAARPEQSEGSAVGPQADSSEPWLLGMTPEIFNRLPSSTDCHRQQTAIVNRPPSITAAQSRARRLPQQERQDVRVFVDELRGGAGDVAARELVLRANPAAEMRNQPRSQALRRASASAGGVGSSLR
jgi:hypothetical protein